MHQFGVRVGFALHLQFTFLARTDVGHATHHAQGSALCIAGDETPVQNPQVVPAAVLNAVFAAPMGCRSGDCRTQ